MPRAPTIDAEHGDEGRFYPANSLAEFVAALAKPRTVVVMVKAGKPVDDMIDELLPQLDPGDILIDGGNSLFSDTARRAELCEARKASRSSAWAFRAARRARSKGRA